jgi:hypothetical protein
MELRREFQLKICSAIIFFSGKCDQYGSAIDLSSCSNHFGAESLLYLLTLGSELSQPI